MGWKRKRLEAMGDDDVNDVYLVGTDEEEVPCCKAFLATISPVFKSMFFRGFKEQNTNRCFLDFHSVVISVIVKYCYCGEVDTDLIFSKNKSLKEEAFLLVELREAGRYFEIEELSSTAEAKIGNLVFRKSVEKKKYQYASAFLTELFKRDVDKDGSLWIALCGFAAKFTMECFGPENDGTDIYHAHPTVLSNVLRESKDTYAAVWSLQAWFSLECKSAGNVYGHEEKRALVEIAENIDLKTLPTWQLSNIRPCSLFSSDRLLEAFVHHCKRPETRTETPRTELTLQIVGADTKYLNGLYATPRYYYDALRDTFTKEVEHNGVKCLSVIHRKRKESKWLISITKKAYSTRLLPVMDKYADFPEDIFEMHVYESFCLSLNSEDAELPPFNSWKRFNVAEPVPIVACFFQ